MAPRWFVLFLKALELPFWGVRFVCIWFHYAFIEYPGTCWGTAYNGRRCERRHGHPARHQYLTVLGTVHTWLQNYAGGGWEAEGSFENPVVHRVERGKSVTASWDVPQRGGGKKRETVTLKMPDNRIRDAMFRLPNRGWVRIHRLPATEVNDALPNRVPEGTQEAPQDRPQE